MSKLTVESCNSITVKAFKDSGNLKRDSSGYFDFNNDETQRVCFSISISPGNEFIKLFYTQVNSSGDKVNGSQTIKLTPLNCHYRGKRYFFTCPYCNRRTGRIYFGGSGFACRHCYNLTYRSRNENNKGQFGFLRKYFEAEKMRESIKRESYNGQYTKRYRRYLAKYENIYNNYSDVIDKLEGGLNAKNSSN